MTVLFSDDFESGGLTNWTGTNGTIAATNGSAFAGSFGCDAQRDEAFAYKDFSAPASQIVTHGAMVKIVTQTGSGQNRLLQISEGGTSIARLIYDNGVYKIWLNQKDGTTATATLIATLSTGVWYELQLVYDWSGAQPHLQLWIDGVADAELTDATSGATRSGTRVFILVFDDSITLTGQVFFDNVVVEDTAPAPPAGGIVPQAAAQYRRRR